MANEATEAGFAQLSRILQQRTNLSSAAVAGAGWFLKKYESDLALYWPNFYPAPNGEIHIELWPTEENDSKYVRIFCIGVDGRMAWVN